MKKKQNTPPKNNLDKINSRSKQYFVLDNFEKIGTISFARLALSALEVLAISTPAKPSIDKQKTK